MAPNCQFLRNPTQMIINPYYKLSVANRHKRRQFSMFMYFLYNWFCFFITKLKLLQLKYNTENVNKVITFRLPADARLTITTTGSLQVYREIFLGLRRHPGSVNAGSSVSRTQPFCFSEMCVWKGHCSVSHKSRWNKRAVCDTQGSPLCLNGVCRERKQAAASSLRKLSGKREMKLWIKLIQESLEKVKAKWVTSRSCS